MDCKCKDKILNIETMANMSIDKIIELYRNGYRLKGIVENLSIDNVSKIFVEDIYSMSPEVMILDAAGYEQPDGKLTVDLLVKNSDPNTLVIGFDFYSTDTTPVSMGPIYRACVVPWSTNGCVTFRVTGLLRKDPFIVHALRCISNPDCTTANCSQFSSIWDSTLTRTVSYTGVPPTYQGIIPTECTPCVSQWVCEQPLNGYEYDSCTQQRRSNQACNSTLTTSTISLNTDKTSPFNKGDVVTFYGILEESGTLLGLDINGVPIKIKIQISGITILDTYITTSAIASDRNWQYTWTVPPTYAGVDTAGRPITVTVSFSGDTSHQPSSKNLNYSVTGVTSRISQISLFSVQTSPFKKGSKVTFYGILEAGIAPYIRIFGVPTTIEIKIIDTTVTTATVMTYAPATTAIKNYDYEWTVPDTIDGIDTAGKEVTATVSFAGNTDYDTSKVTKTFSIESPGAGTGAMIMIAAAVLVVGTVVYAHK